MAPSAPATITDLLSVHPHSFLQPSKTLHDSLLEVAKDYLDPLASRVTETQLARQKIERSQNKKRKRAQNGGPSKEELLRMKKIHVQGFELDQVWAQARRVLEHASNEVERSMPAPESEDEDDEVSNGGKVDSVDMEDVDELDEDSLGEEGVDWEYDGPDLSEVEVAQDEDEDGESLQDDSEDIGDETPPSDIEDDKQSSGPFAKDKFGLNDGYFSIDQFNKQTQFLEQQDANGDSDDGRASDEEDVDWELDPFAVDPRAGDSKKSRGKSKRRDDNEDNEDDEGDGPTFGNVDLYAPEGESEEEAMLDGDDEEEDFGHLGDLGNANNIMASNFWGPPPTQRQSKKPKARRNHGNERDLAFPQDNDMTREDDIERTMSAVHRDLFEDDLSADEEEEEEDEEGGETIGGKNLSSHEKSQLALRKEIRRLEAENVANKHWSLTGETAAPHRPENALLEEDLDFERAGKPVPIITSEVNESIEDLIKRRILSKEFDEVVRRRPTELVPGGKDAAKRGRLEEVSDQKSKVGLAEEYEADYLKRSDPNYVDTRSAALKAKHSEIESQWIQISAQLDALSNWHYKPRPPAASMDVRVDVPTIAMEDARPSVNGIGGAESALAPQDVYRPGDEKGKRGAGEVVTKGGTAVAREEESRESKKRRRRREKERVRKSLGNNEQKQNGVSGASNGGKTDTNPAGKKEVVGQLKKGGVKVIGRKGEITDVAGKGIKNKTTANAGSFKL